MLVINNGPAKMVTLFVDLDPNAETELPIFLFAELNFTYFTQKVIMNLLIMERIIFRTYQKIQHASLVRLW